MPKCPSLQSHPLLLFSLILLSHFLRPRAETSVVHQHNTNHLCRGGHYLRHLISMWSTRFSKIGIIRWSWRPLDIFVEDSIDYIVSHLQRVGEQTNLSPSSMRPYLLTEHFLHSLQSFSLGNPSYYTFEIRFFFHRMSHTLDEQREMRTHDYNRKQAQFLSMAR